MYSLNFPDIFSGTTTTLLLDKEATFNNLKLVLASSKNQLFGDPDFGANMKRYLYELGSQFIKDMITEELYKTIRLYILQINVEKNNIKVNILNNSDTPKISIDILYTYITNKELDTFTLVFDL